MKVDVHHNKQKNGIELHFTETPPAELTDILKALGFKPAYQQPRKWTVRQHPAYAGFARSLQQALLNDLPYTEIPVFPSYDPIPEHITTERFSLVEVHYSEDGQKRQRDYVLFEPYKRVASYIAHQYAHQTYGESLQRVRVYERNHKTRARAALRDGHIIRGDEPRPTSPDDSTSSEPLTTTDPLTNTSGVYTPETSGDRFETLVLPIPKNAKTEASIELVQGSDEQYRYGLSVSKQFGDHSGHGFSPSLSGPTFASREEALIHAMVLIQDTIHEWIQTEDHILNNQEKKNKQLQRAYDAVRHYAEETGLDIFDSETPSPKPTSEPTPLPEAPAPWQQTQLEYQQQQAIEKTGSPRVLDARDRQAHEALVVQALSDGLLIPKRVLEDYPWLEESPEAEPDPEPIAEPALETPVAPEPTSAPPKNPYGYLDAVIAHLHEQYGNHQRPTKGYIDKLGDQLNVPSRGHLWEAAELSWLLWYKLLYRQALPFEARLHEMILFWDQWQPTYQYSDSSKELYKQYSTPCPIGAIVAQYTRMDRARNIFEPSAGNGLLLVGADQGKVHANEIDATRLASLRFQQFQTITSYNAAEPFPDDLHRTFDVVVTNPPFTRWEDTKTDKDHLIRTYFHNQIGLARNLRLEHFMAGLALHCLKNTGRAAILIMGHLRFGADGLVGKYRPFFNWLYRHYQVDDVINLNSFKLYNKQGAVVKTMLLLVAGRKKQPEGVAPTRNEAPHLEDLVGSFADLWTRVRMHLSDQKHSPLKQLIQQLQIELAA